MTTTTYTVTHPDGTKSTRQSKTRSYTHAVVAGPRDLAVAAQQNRAQAAELRAHADKIEAAATANQVRIGKNRPGGGRLPLRAWLAGAETIDGQYLDVPATFDHKTETLVYNTDGTAKRDEDGREVWQWVSTRLAVLGKAHRQIRDYRTMADGHDRQAAAYEAGELPASEAGYGVVRWSSSPVSAQRAADGEFAYLRAAGHPVTVVLVD